MSDFTGIITSAMKTLYTDAIDSLLEDTACTVPCRLIYGGADAWSYCNNCLWSTVRNRSSGVYNGTGPQSFSVGNCPVCNGRGKIPSDSTETIYVIPLWNYKDWIWSQGTIDVQFSYGFVQTISKLTTLDEIKRAKEMVLDTDIEAYEKHRYQRHGEPNPIGFGASSYIFTMWKRT